MAGTKPGMTTITAADSSTHQELVDRARAEAAFADRPDDQ